VGWGKGLLGKGKECRDRVQVAVAGLVSLIKPKWARVFQKSLLVFA